MNETSAIIQPDRHVPGYLRLGLDRIKERAERARAMLSPCRVCPRECGVDRLNGKPGFCNAPAQVKVSSYNAHHGEEPPLSGYNGSGTIFFTHCNLRCLFCQNYPISHLGHGDVIGTEALAAMMIKLQRRQCHNINFVTPSHYVPQIIEAVIIARENGLRIPLLYNSSGYDSVESLKLLDGIIDIYLPDMKYGDDENAMKLSSAPHYSAVNRAAVKEMHRQVGELMEDDEGIAIRGLIIRHLVLPHGLAGSEKILEFIAHELSPNTMVSLMSQYFPAHRASEIKGLERRVSEEVYYAALEKIKSLGLPTGLVQYY